MGNFINILLLTICTIFIVAAILLYGYMQYTVHYWKKRNIAYLEPWVLFVYTKQLLMQQKGFGDCFLEIYTAIKEKSKLFGGVHIMGKPMLMIINPDIIKDILTKEFAHFPNRGLFVDEENDPLSAHLVSLNGMKWKNLRTKLTPTFTSGKMKMMFHTILDCCKGLEIKINDHLKYNEAIDIKEIFSRLTTDTIVSCAFGLECDSLQNPDNEFRKYGKKIFNFDLRDNIVGMMTITFPWILKSLKIPQINPDVSKFFLNIVRQTVDYREKNGIRRKDFLDLLIRLKNCQSVLDDNSDSVDYEQQGLTFNELAAQAFIFFGAGFETTSTTLNFCMFELAENTKIQDKLRKEVMETLEMYNGELSYDAIMDMKYMHKIFMEVLRKYPPIGTLNRECIKNYNIPGTDYIIEKGTPVLMSTIGLHRDPEYYPDPEIFDPERFNEDVKSNRNPYVFLPFGEGPRICIGMRFALLQVKLVLAVLMRRFKFTLDPKTVTPIILDPKSAFTAPKNTIWLRAHKID